MCTMLIMSERFTLLLLLFRWNWTFV